ncbi:hypothetical protein HY491_00005 [Candidatus Woesearchaeota archaeon]|nr:hypothetical protein [Candidatus Woesearchaeota archaeon]
MEKRVAGMGLEQYFSESEKRTPAAHISWAHFSERLHDYHSPEYHLFSSNRFFLAKGGSNPEVIAWSGNSAFPAGMLS